MAGRVNTDQDRAASSYVDGAPVIPPVPPTPVTDERAAGVRAAQWCVDHNLGHADLVDLLDMLGITPGGTR